LTAGKLNYDPYVTIVIWRGDEQIEPSMTKPDHIHAKKE